jgi:hypothetical protein
MIDDDDWIFDTTDGMTGTYGHMKQKTEDDLITVSIDDTDLQNYTGSYTTTMADDTITLSDDRSFDFSTSDLTGFNYNPGIDLTQGDIAVHNDGDIKLGDRSLKQFMNKVDERLNILQPNPELEAEWDELKRLGEEYRKMEQELLEKNKMWEKLKEQ